MVFEFKIRLSSILGALDARVVNEALVLEDLERVCGWKTTDIHIPVTTQTKCCTRTQKIRLEGKRKGFQSTRLLVNKQTEDRLPICGVNW